MNYAETLAYWYLRLNGFFPLRNFVLHRSGEAGSLEHSADADLLAIRPPHVFEAIAGAQLKTDPELEEELGTHSQSVGLIVEVKSGHLEQSDLDRVLIQPRLTAAVQRLGIVSKGKVPSIVAALLDQRSCKHEDWTIAKLLVTPHMKPASWLNRSVEQLDRFICTRFKEFDLRKAGDRMFFPDELIQYLAWKAANSRN